MSHHFTRVILSAAACLTLSCSAGKSVEEGEPQSYSQDAVTSGVRRSSDEDGVLVGGKKFKITAAAQSTRMALQDQDSGGESSEPGDENGTPSDDELQQLTSTCGTKPTTVLKLTGRQTPTDASSEFTANSDSMTAIVLTGTSNQFTVNIAPIANTSAANGEGNDAAAARLTVGQVCVVIRGNDNLASASFTGADLAKLHMEVSGNSSGTIALQDATVVEFSSSVAGNGSINMTGAADSCSHIVAAGNGKVTCS